MSDKPYVSAEDLIRYLPSWKSSGDLLDRVANIREGRPTGWAASLPNFMTCAPSKEALAKALSELIAGLHPGGLVTVDGVDVKSRTISVTVTLPVLYTNDFTAAIVGLPESATNESDCKCGIRRAACEYHR